MSEMQNWLLKEFQGHLCQALEAMTAESAAVEINRGALHASGDLLWWEQQFSTGPDTQVWIGTPEESWREIGARTLEAAGIEQSETAEMQSTWQEILSQTLSGLAQSIGSRLGKEVNCSAGTPSSEPKDIQELIISLGAAKPLPLKIGFSAGLLSLLAPPEQIQPAASAPSVSHAITGAEPAPKMIPGSKTMDLLLEVELPVSVSFGRAQLRLKDVIKLTTGSIVELNRSISEPVEVIVNNCVIARGEVVVIDGYYGVRIHQIISRQDRLRTLV
ncbi:MAG: flagellar motor switch protein FliN [Bryobacteraceae bacterium]